MSTYIFQIPVFQRGGSIIPRKERVRRCSSVMINDPYTLVIALNKSVESQTLNFLMKNHILVLFKFYVIDVYGSNEK